MFEVEWPEDKLQPLPRFLQYYDITSLIIHIDHVVISCWMYVITSPKAYYLFLCPIQLSDFQKGEKNRGKKDILSILS